MTENKLEIQVPKKLIPIFDKTYRTKTLYGGRSSAKTHSVVQYLITRGMEERLLILCCREYQSSIARSTYSELKSFIIEKDLVNFFKIKRDKIVGINGTEFIFVGLARDPYGLKGIPKIGICYVDEAETISEFSWEILIPTVEKNQKAEIILSFNPRDSQSSTYTRFVKNHAQLAGKNLLVEINYNDNPFLSERQLESNNKLKEFDYPKYEHIYLGKVLDATEDVIFKGRFKIDEIEIKRYKTHWEYKNKHVVPLYGMDFGFSVDPTAIVEIFLLDDNILYINREIYERGLLPSDYRNTIGKKMPEAIKEEFLADSARPDTIAQLCHDGLKVSPAVKNKGSIEAGVEWLKGKKIYINPTCENTIFEFYNYKYKVDKNTEKVTSDIIDKHNHLMDAIRYGCSRQIISRRKKRVISDTMVHLISTWR